jgi:RNA polymerase sigma factor (sigma-70 family)
MTATAVSDPQLAFGGDIVVLEPQRAAEAGAQARETARSGGRGRGRDRGASPGRSRAAGQAGSGASDGAGGQRTSMTVLRRCSDDQLVERFRDGSGDAFRVIHDRYRVRLRAYVREMLAGRPKEDVEDVLQDVFERAARSVLLDGAPIGLRAWLYGIARNRCIDELRRRPPTAHEVHAMLRPPACDTTAVVERRAEVDRLFRDLHDLPELQRSALLMRELQGLSHVELGQALDTSVPAVKSLLVRARVGLVDAQQARNVPCAAVRESLAATYDRGVKPRREASQHLRECDACTSYRVELRRASHRLAALAPGPVGLPIGLIGRLLGRFAAHSQAPVAATGAAGPGAVAFAGAGKLAAVLSAAAILTTGAALELNGRLGPLFTPFHPTVGSASATGGVPLDAHDGPGTPGGPTTGEVHGRSTARGSSPTPSGGMAFIPGKSGPAGGRPGSGEAIVGSGAQRPDDDEPDGVGANAAPTSVAGDGDGDGGGEPSSAASTSAAQGRTPASRPLSGALAPAGAIGAAVASAIPAVIGPSGALSKKPPAGMAGAPAAVVGAVPAVVGSAASAVAGAPAGVAGQLAGPTPSGEAATAGSTGGAQSFDDAQSNTAGGAGGAGVTGAVSGVASSVSGVAGAVGLGGGSGSSLRAQAVPGVSG